MAVRMATSPTRSREGEESGVSWQKAVESRAKVANLEEARS